MLCEEGGFIALRLAYLQKLIYKQTLTYIRLPLFCKAGVGSSTLFNMNHYDVKRLALVLAVQAEIEGMKAANAQHPENQPYTKEQFDEKAFRLESLAYMHDEQL